jgi:hypothetical protein
MNHLPKTREEAKEKNSKWYFTGTSCPNGHIAERYTKSYECRECRRLADQSERRKEYIKSWRKEHPNRGKETRKWDRMRLEYGLTKEQYDQFLQDQNNCCAICKNSFNEGGNHNEKAHIDHNHLTNKIRGLLCGYCNVGIGMLKDSLPIVESAMNYLKSNCQE